MMKNFRQILVIALAFAAMVSCQQKNTQPLQLASIFANNQVLQRQTDVPVWGKATPGEKITVTFRNQVAKTRADKNGKWIIRLTPMEAGGPDSLVVKSNQKCIVINNILVGEVWVCSGQSNMEMPLISNWSHVNNREEEVANANFPNIRFITVDRHIIAKPIDTISSAGWQLCSPETAGNLSATSYFFGRRLYQELNIPIGLIVTSWGGTTIETWISKSALDTLSEFKDKIAKLNTLPCSADSMAMVYKSDVELMNREMAEADPGIDGTDTLFIKPNYDHSAWMKMDLPAFWESTAIGSFNGTVWFRKTIELPARLAGKPLTIGYGAPDDYDEVWMNGIKIGGSTSWDVPRVYKIPAGLTKAGKNVITIRITDNQGGGGFMGKKSDFFLTDNRGWRIKIDKDWSCMRGYELSQIKTQPIRTDFPNFPTLLYNGMINPLIPYAMRGVIWYQGESNSDRAWQYNYLFKTMITDWRQKWGQGDFPFLFVQLASFMVRNSEPVDDTWAELREAQANALQLPNTGMAVTIDIGDAKDIHPGNKQDVGKRLAGVALNDVYKQNTECKSPRLSKMEENENAIELYFIDIYQGLKTSDNQPLRGFAIAGDDYKFVWAKAEIVGQKIRVWSDAIKHPVAVRYGWSANPDVNVVNSAGLPLCPFRTDKLPEITKGKY